MSEEGKHLEKSGRTRTRVGIVGAGPAGLLIGNLLLQAGIPCLITEQQTRSYVEGRARAGLIEDGVVQCLQRAGLANRLLQEGVAHSSCEFRYQGRSFRLPYGALCGGKSHVVYPQQELVKDLIAAYFAAGGEILFETPACGVTWQEDGPPAIQTHSGQIVCDFVVGCDGSHSAMLQALPAGKIHVYSQRYNMGLLAVLASAPPSTKEIIYAVHERGFAGHMLRTATQSRYYLQCPVDDSPEHWPDERIWQELTTRLKPDFAWTLTQGPIVEKRVLEMRSFVCEPMQYGPVYLVGDAAHVLTPVGAKGMNLALADALRFVEGVRQHYEHNDQTLLHTYSERSLQHVWAAQAFSDGFIQTLFPPNQQDSREEFTYQLQLARLAALCTSPAAATHFAQEYAGRDLAFQPVQRKLVGQS